MGDEAEEVDIMKEVIVDEDDWASWMSCTARSQDLLVKNRCSSCDQGCPTQEILIRTLMDQLSSNRWVQKGILLPTVKARAPNNFGREQHEISHTRIHVSSSAF